MRPFVLMLAALIAGCSDSQSVDGSIAASGTAGDARPRAPEASVPFDPGTVPVGIGDGGPGFPACQSTGLVVRTDALVVRRAPFLEGAEADRIGEGVRVAVCTRSHDRRWLGVVYPEPDVAAAGEQAVRPAIACGVAQPVARRRAYDGPCRSGWIDSAFVRLVSG